MTGTATTAAQPAAVRRRLETFAAIGLDELIDRAALQTRVDRKYVVPVSDLPTILAGLAPDTQVLEIEGRRDFGYESVYFDTPELTSYHLAAQGRRRRFKIRTRTYLDSHECYLEVKTRGARSSTVKDRLEYAEHQRAFLTDDGRGYTDATLTGTGIAAIDSSRLASTLSTRYGRTTLFVPSSASRATIDTNLAWLRGEQRLDLPDTAIVETKSGSQASVVDRLLWSHGYRPATISKYATGLAALRPDLPANKWARILRRQFGRPAVWPSTTSNAS